ARHDDRVRAFSLVSEAAISAATFDMFLDLLRSLHGPNLLRLKGIVKLAETPASPIVVHGVQHVFHPVVQPPAWPDGDARTRIVVITRDLEPAAVRALFDAFLGAAALDQPDRAALVDNPLVPFGGGAIVSSRLSALLPPLPPPGRCPMLRAARTTNRGAPARDQAWG